MDESIYLSLRWNTDNRSKYFYKPLHWLMSQTLSFFNPSLQSRVTIQSLPIEPSLFEWSEMKFSSFFPQASERKMEIKPKEQTCLHEMLMQEIRSTNHWKRLAHNRPLACKFTKSSPFFYCQWSCSVRDLSRQPSLEYLTVSYYSGCINESIRYAVTCLFVFWKEIYSNNNVTVDGGYSKQRTAWLIMKKMKILFIWSQIHRGRIGMYEL